MKFPSADAVFVPIVAVHGGDVAVGIGVALPSAAVVKDVVDASDGVFAADTEGYGVVFAIFGSRKIDGAEQWGEESAGGT